MESNERLEFLGDSVLGLAVTDHIFSQYSNLPEGQLAKLRASVVNTDALARIAVWLNVGPHIRLGKGEDSSGGRNKESILADSVEALIGAVYTDSDWPTAQKLVLSLTEDSIHKGAADPGAQDYKTQLQELVARSQMGSPSYEIAGSGPDHDRSFEAKAVIEGSVWGVGSGRSKKRAEQAAAKRAKSALIAHLESLSTEEQAHLAD